MNKSQNKPTIGWSLKLGRILGIDVYIHITFLLLLGFIGISQWLTGKGAGAAWNMVLFFGGVFLCVLLHEFGHAMAARRYGIGTREITLLPIGGLARLERMPEKPVQELVVALAGPAVNVVIAAGLFLGLWLGGHWQSGLPLNAGQWGLLERLLTANLFLVAFNLLPAFPMDGGRVLRSLLAMRMSKVRATNIAATIGRGMAVLFGFVGLFSNPMLLLIALFVWIGATQEAAATEMKSSFNGVPVREAMLTRFETVSPHGTVTEAARLLLAVSQQDFPVVENGRVTGLLTRDAIIKTLRERGDYILVGEVMERDIVVARPDELLEAVMAQSAVERPGAVPVEQNGRLVGLLTPDNIGELYMITAALQARGLSRGAAPPIIAQYRRLATTETGAA